MRRLVFSLLFLLPGTGIAQGASEVYLLQISAQEETVWVKTIKNISDHKGYDNQPYFTPDGKYILYTSIRKDQADIYRYHITKEKRKKVTSTPESEYSPRSYPLCEGISTVRVEKDSAQHLRLYTTSSENAERLMPDYDSVGYYCWIGTGHVAMFILGEPHYLVIADLNGQEKLTFNGIGRSIHQVPGTEKVSFVWKKNEETWWLCSVDVNGNLAKLDTFEPPYEDYCWLPDGRIAYAKGSRILIAKPGELNPTPFSFDLGPAGIHGITRVAVNSDGTLMTVVGTEAQSPPSVK